jgi:hypothetical protein
VKKPKVSPSQFMVVSEYWPMMKMFGLNFFLLTSIVTFVLLDPLNISPSNRIDTGVVVLELTARSTAYCHVKIVHL